MHTFPSNDFVQLGICSILKCFNLRQIFLLHVCFCQKVYICNTFYLQVCYARVLDYRRKFIEAAQRYNELSYKAKVADEERMEALKNALICTILASAG